MPGAFSVQFSKLENRKKKMKIEESETKRETQRVALSEKI